MGWAVAFVDDNFSNLCQLCYGTKTCGALAHTDRLSLQYSTVGKYLRDRRASLNGVWSVKDTK